MPTCDPGQVRAAAHLCSRKEGGWRSLCFQTAMEGDRLQAEKSQGLRNLAFSGRAKVDLWG